MKTRVDKAANVAIKTASLILVSLATFVVGLARQRGGCEAVYSGK